MSGKGYIAPEPYRPCELCGTITECRPYGLNREQICIDCGDKLPPELIEQRMNEYILGERSH